MTTTGKKRIKGKKIHTYSSQSLPKNLENRNRKEKDGVHTVQIRKREYELGGGGEWKMLGKRKLFFGPSTV